MANTNEQPGPPDFPQILRGEEQRRKAQDKAIALELKKGIIPTPEIVVRTIVWRVDRHVLMRDHIYAREDKLRSGLDALISAALAANLDLGRAEAALTAFAQSRDGFEDHIGQTVENPAQKEVMAFCTAYVGTVDTLRRFKERRADIWHDIDTLRKATTDDIIYRFIFELRRNLSHGSVVVPYWNVRTDESGTSGSIHFSASELLAFGSWGAEVKGYLSTLPDDSFSIAQITARCAQGLAKFRRELNILFARNRTDAERDYHAINDLSRRLVGAQFNKLVLKQIAAQGVDPFAHLHRFFSPQETRRILEYPAHSVEQVEYVIRLREAQTAVDPELRSLLYELFKVPVSVEVPKQAPSISPRSLDELWPPAGFRNSEAK